MVNPTNSPGTIYPTGSPVAKGDIRQWMSEMIAQVNSEFAFSGKQFGSRAQAASVGQAGLPSTLGMIVTMESGVLTYRLSHLDADDPLFPGAAPYWGVVRRVDTMTLARDAGLMSLANIGGTADALTAELPSAAKRNGVAAISGTSTVLIYVAGTNTVEPTLSIDGGTAMVIKSEAGAAFAAGQFGGGRYYQLTRHGSGWRVMAGSVGIADLANAVAAEAVARAQALAGTNAMITGVSAELSQPMETADHDGVHWGFWDGAGNGLLGWSETGMRVILDDATLANAGPRLLSDPGLDVALSTAETLDARVLERDAAGNAVVLWREDGFDAHMSQDFWDRGRAKLQIEGGLLSTTAVQICGVDGQSLSVGGAFTAALTRAMLEALGGDHCLQLAGMQFSDAVPITDTLGPRVKGYNLTKAATGFERAQTGSGASGMAFPAFALLNAHRRDLGLAQVPIVTSCHGIPGIAIEDMDADPATGSGQVTVWSNFSYWNAQAKAVAEAAGKAILPGWHLWDHGTSAKTSPRGDYLEKWWKLQAESLAYWRGQGLPAPRYILTQPSGDADTTNDGATGWAVCDDMLDLVEQGGAILGTCQHWYEIADNNVHPDAEATALASETCAWAMAEVEAGHRWSILRPHLLSHEGGVLVLQFASLREDEALALEDAAKYGGQGIDAFAGFELVGGAITALTLRGNTARITYTGAPTALRYAMQVQNVTGIAGNRFTAHRGLLRTTLQKPSKILPARKLQRPVPSFTLNLGA
ncbi:hypothetical protein [Paracoccus cavernae]|uniref:hypothetical protein n=1 Tax=Paracoccus cavernae TaxID=1571207 RepID=UPI00361402CD